MSEKPDTSVISDYGTFNGRPFNKTEFFKIIGFLEELDSFDFNSKKDFDLKIKDLRKKYKYNPSVLKLYYIYMKTIDPEWHNAPEIYKDYHFNDKFAYFMNNQKRDKASYGVLNVTVFTPPLNSCEYSCKFCPINPQNNTAPQSYFNNEPGVARADQYKYDIIKQIRGRLKDYSLKGDILREKQSNSKRKIKAKVDIRIAGGTFHSYPIKDRREFIRQVYYAVRTIDYLDEQLPPMMSLDEEIKYHVDNNDLIGVLICALSIETRPDKINYESIKELNRYYLTWIELGVQTTHNDILKKVGRGHTVEQSELGIAMCKSVMGVKVLTHIMPDLPGTTPERDIEIFKDKIVKNDTFIQRNLNFILISVFSIFYALIREITGFFISTIITILFYKILCKPAKIEYSLPHLSDHIKIYPTMNLPDTEISKWGKDKWDPYAEKEDGQILMNVLCEIIPKLPPWIRIARLIRDFQKASEENDGWGYTSKTIKSNMAQLIDQRLKNNNIIVQEIKSQEIKNSFVDLNRIRLRYYSYECSPKYNDYAAKCIFLKLEAPTKYNEFKLIGLLRLRLNYKSNPITFDHAIIRELHIYGNYIPKGVIPLQSNIVQHRGYGKFLLKIAEFIAYIHGYRSITVISAPGTMAYYIKRGYHQEGRYPVKELNFNLFVRNLGSIIGSGIGIKVGDFLR